MPHEKLPRGVWYDAERGRFRCRIYRNNNVYHLSYHEDSADAITTLKRVKNIIEAPLGSIDTLIEQVSLYYKKTQ
jgi:hypothetical protein